MSASYKLNKKCGKCKTKLLDKNKSGFCNHHRDRTGKNNSFYGKKHIAKSIEVVRIKTSIATKEKWKDKRYRELVIKGTSKPRRESFKKEQSERITQWYKDNPNQREIRRIKMKESWRTGKIISDRYFVNESKLELELFGEIKKIFSDAKKNQTIRVSDGKWLFPDILIEPDGIIIEFYGNFWHANPNLYKASDEIHYGITAQEIWKRDKDRIRRLEHIVYRGERFATGYRVIVVWEDEYKNNKERILREINGLYNLESCNL